MASHNFLPGAGQSPDVQWHGVYKGVIAQRGTGLRVKIKVPQVMGAALTNWALPFNHIGSVSPPVGSAVSVTFMGGDPNFPFYSPLVPFPGTQALAVNTVSAGGAVTSGSISTGPITAGAITATSVTTPGGGSPSFTTLTVTGLSTLGGILLTAGKFIASADTWHSIGVGNGMSGSINYKLTAENEVFLVTPDPGLNCSSNPSGTICTLPVGYRPANTAPIWYGSHTGTGNFMERFTLQTNGHLDANGFGAGGVYMCVRVPLDLP